MFKGGCELLSTAGEQRHGAEWILRGRRRHPGRRRSVRQSHRPEGAGAVRALGDPPARDAGLRHPRARLQVGASVYPAHGAGGAVLVGPHFT